MATTEPVNPPQATAVPDIAATPSATPSVASRAPFLNTATGKQVLVLVGLVGASVLAWLSNLQVSGKAQVYVGIAIFVATALVHYADSTIPNTPNSPS